MMDLLQYILQFTSEDTVSPVFSKDFEQYVNTVGKKQLHNHLLKVADYLQKERPKVGRTSERIKNQPNQHPHQTRSRKANQAGPTQDDRRQDDRRPSTRMNNKNKYIKLEV